MPDVRCEKIEWWLGELAKVDSTREAAMWADWCEFKAHVDNEIKLWRSVEASVRRKQASCKVRRAWKE
jgi:hypothetical protein